jgi:polysaccharide biosynthesis/export protein
MAYFVGALKSRIRRGRMLRYAFVIAVIATVGACATSNAGMASAGGAMMPDLAGASKGEAIAGPERRLVPHDLVEITVFGAPDLSRTVRVDATGEVALPLIGTVEAAGGTPRDLEKSVAAALRERYMRDPQVLVELKEEAPQPIYVLGEVHQPGAFTGAISDGVTVIRAVTLARGLKPSAAHGRIVVIRTTAAGERLQIPVDLNAVVRGRSLDMPLLPNDVVYVPKSTERAIALGMVDALLRVVTFRAVF